MDGCQLFTEVEVGRCLNFKYIKYPRCLPCGWLPIIHRSGSWNLCIDDTTHTSCNPGMCKNVDQVIRIQHHTNMVFSFRVDWNPSIRRHLVSNKLLKALLPQNFQNYWKMSLHSWDAIFAQCWRVVLFASSIFFYGIAYPHGNDSFPKCCKVLVDFITMLHFPKTNKTLTHRDLCGHWWLTNKTLILSPDIVIQFGVANLYSLSKVAIIMFYAMMSSRAPIFVLVANHISSLVEFNKSPIL